MYWYRHKIGLFTSIAHKLNEYVDYSEKWVLKEKIRPRSTPFTSCSSYNDVLSELSHHSYLLLVILNRNGDYREVLRVHNTIGSKYNAANFKTRNTQCISGLQESHPLLQMDNIFALHGDIVWKRNMVGTLMPQIYKLQELVKPTSFKICLGDLKYQAIQMKLE